MQGFEGWDRFVESCGGKWSRNTLAAYRAALVAFCADIEPRDFEKYSPIMAAMEL